MNTERGIIKLGDAMYAEMVVAGKSVARLVCIRTITCLADIMRMLRSISSVSSGFASVTIRNSTRGWATNLSIVLA